MQFQRTDHVEEVFADVPQHPWKCRSEEILNTRGPTGVLPVSLQIVYVLKTKQKDFLTKLGTRKLWQKIYYISNCQTSRTMNIRNKLQILAANINNFHEG